MIETLSDSLNLIDSPTSKSHLRDVANEVMEKVTRDPFIESVWLTTLAHMEQLAADQIRTNISAFTPTEDLASIESHAADEERHAQQILEMRPHTTWTETRYETLLEKMKYLGQQFVVGYFGNPLLIQAKNKHAAYAHGALTIEQFPFQIYVSYLKYTQLQPVKSVLPVIIRDEQNHLSLGRRLRDNLQPHEQLSLERLLKIEEDMCIRMLRRMNQALSRFFGQVSPATTFESLVSQSHDATVAWAHSLGYAEELAAQHMQRVYESRQLPLPEMMPAHVSDELRHSKILKRTVILDRRRLASRSPEYAQLEKSFRQGLRFYQMQLFSSLLKKTSNPDEIYLYGALALEMRVFKHYKDLALETDHIGLSHVLSVILDEEADHTRQASRLMTEKGLSMEKFREVSQFEKIFWENMIEEISESLIKFIERSTKKSAV